MHAASNLLRAVPAQTGPTIGVPDTSAGHAASRIGARPTGSTTSLPTWLNNNRRPFGGIQVTHPSVAVSRVPTLLTRCCATSCRPSGAERLPDMIPAVMPLREDEWQRTNFRNCLTHVMWISHSGAERSEEPGINNHDQ